MNKKRKLGNHADEYMQEKPEVFGEREYDDEIFDLMDEEHVEVTTDEIPITSIWADPTQPRRIVPSEIRDDWTGDPAKMPELLQAWAEMLYDSGNDLPIDKILKGQVEPYQYQTGDAFVDKFVSLLVLASQIRGVGLNHRIGVRPQGHNYIIIHGERRWTAFHILNHFLPMEASDYANIPAKVAHVDAWTIAKMQAQENVREEPNAIGKARMYAKLLMAAYADNPEYKFDPPHAVNSPTCDRPWYAQAKNLRIPRGMGAEFETALGISTAQMRQYSKLLSLVDNYEIDNTIWNLADDNDWAEQFQRQIPQYLEVKDINEILYTVTTVTVSQVEEAFREAIESAKKGEKLAKKQKQREEKPYLNRWVELSSGWVGRVTDQNGKHLTLEDIDGEMNMANIPLIVDVDVSPRSNHKESPSPSGSEATTMGRDLGRGSDDEPEDLPCFKPTETVFYDGTIPARIRGYNDDGSVTIVVWNGDQKTVDEDDLLPLDEQEYIAIVQKLRNPQNNAGADNSSSQPLNEDVKRASEWVSKPAHYQGEPCFVVQVAKDMPGHVIIQRGKDRVTVHYDDLKPIPGESGQTLNNFMNGDEGGSDKPISSIDSLPVKSPHIITGIDRGFINGIILGCSTEGLKWDKLRDVYQLRQNTDEDLPQLLEQAMRQIEAYTNHLRDKATAIFSDIAQQHMEDTNG